MKVNAGIVAAICREPAPEPLAVPQVTVPRTAPYVGACVVPHSVQPVEAIVWVTAGAVLVPIRPR